MSEPFPPIEPYASGLLSVDGGHQVYWECCGNPTGEPALVLHGGPGSGCSAGQRRFFDPARYRVVLFDQRGAGRSLPSAGRPHADLSANTIHHLIADIEALRDLHAVERWTILGLSWGTTLGLGYAQVHPDRVRALVLGFVTTTSRREVRWMTEDMGRIFPEEWERFAGAVPDHLKHLDLVDAYAVLLAHPDATVRDVAARAWCAWEEAHVSLTPGHTPNPRFQDAEFRLGFARLVTHYWRHAAFLDDDQLIRDAAKLNGIPGVLIHGRYDVSGPLITAWRLHRQWTSSRLHILDDAGHGGGNTFMPLVVGALNDLANL